MHLYFDQTLLRANFELGNRNNKIMTFSVNRFWLEAMTTTTTTGGREREKQNVISGSVPPLFL